MSHEVIIIHQGQGDGGSADGRISYKPSHNLTEAEQFKRLKHASHVLETLLDSLYEPASSSAPTDD